MCVRVCVRVRVCACLLVYHKYDVKTFKKYLSCPHTHTHTLHPPIVSTVSTGRKTPLRWAVIGADEHLSSFEVFAQHPLTQQVCLVERKLCLHGVGGVGVQ